jgi:hypothetical protein
MLTKAVRGYLRFRRKKRGDGALHDESIGEYKMAPQENLETEGGPEEEVCGKEEGGNIDLLSDAFEQTFEEARSRPDLLSNENEQGICEIGRESDADKVRTRFVGGIFCPMPQCC